MFVSMTVSLDSFSRAIRCHLNFDDRPSSFGDRRGGGGSLESPPVTRVMENTPVMRGFRSRNSFECV